MSNLIIVRSSDIYVIFNHDNDMFKILLDVRMFYHLL